MAEIEELEEVAVSSKSLEIRETKLDREATDKEATKHSETETNPREETWINNNIEEED